MQLIPHSLLAGSRVSAAAAGLCFKCHAAISLIDFLPISQTSTYCFSSF
jgi:hypothetical protein